MCLTTKQRRSLQENNHRQGPKHLRQKKTRTGEESKAEAKRARRNQRKLEVAGDAKPLEESQDVDLNTPEVDSTNSDESR